LTFHTVFYSLGRPCFSLSLLLSHTRTRSLSFDFPSPLSRTAPSVRSPSSKSSVFPIHENIRSRTTTANALSVLVTLICRSGVYLVRGRARARSFTPLERLFRAGRRIPPLARIAASEREGTFDVRAALTIIIFRKALTEAGDPLRSLSKLKNSKL